jgi:hypothetical protein
MSDTGIYDPRMPDPSRHVHQRNYAQEGTMTNPYRLARGPHNTAADGLCAMEWVSFIAGENHTDQPVCVDLPLRSFCIGLNDDLDDEQRQRLRPYLGRCIGTTGDGRTSERGYMCLDWIVRTYTPTWLELAGLADDAAALRALPEIVDLDTAKVAGPVVRASQKKADAAWTAAGDAAWTAAGDAARAAAGDAARAAARTAAWTAARDAAWTAARAAAGDAAWTAAGAALASTVKALQDSAFDLLDRMLPKVMIDLPEPVAERAREVFGG